MATHRVDFEELLRRVSAHKLSVKDGDEEQSDASALLAALRDGDVDAVTTLLQDGDLSGTNREGDSALMWAARGSHIDMVELLLDHGMEVDATDAEGRTALLHAATAAEMCAEIVDALLRHGASPSLQAFDGDTPLLAASRLGRVAVVKTLLERGASVLETRDGNSALHFAAQRGHTDVVKVLLEKGASVLAKARKGESALSLASHAGHFPVVQVLLDRGAPVNEKAPNGNTLLHFATLAHHVGIAKLLIARGVSVDEANADGLTALDVGSSEGCYEIVKLLLDHGAAVDGKRSDGRTPLIAAAFRGRCAVLQLLLGDGATSAASNPHGETALFLAAREDHVVAVKVLLAGKASVDQKTNEGWTALHVAAHRGHRAVAALLLAAGASVDEKDRKSESALHIASQQGHTDVVDVLLCHGAAVEQTNFQGETALHSASRCGHIDSVRALLVGGAIVSAKNSDGETALHSACREGHIEVVRLLREHGASIDTCNVQNETPLIAAGRSGRTGRIHLMRTLIESGASINVQAADGETPLLAAAKWGFLDLVQLLISNAGATVIRAEATPLLPATLNAMKKECRIANEFETVCEHVVTRLQDICAQLRHRTEDVLLNTLVVLAKIIFRFYRLELSCEQKHLILRLIASRKLQNQVQDFHTEIDHFMRVQELDSTASIHSEWSALLDEDCSAKLATLVGAVMQDHEMLLRSVREDLDPVKTMILLSYELDKCRESSNPEQLRLMEAVLEKIAQYSDSVAPALPRWFLPRYEIEMGDLAKAQNRRYTTKRYGKWLNSTVMISECHASQDQLMQHAARWFQLSHPNVLKLYGAYHIGLPYLFVHEFASNGTLREFVLTRANRSLTWQKLYEAALGLQYLHERSIVHGDLKCENILIGASGNAKIAGFESQLANSSKPRRTASRWMAPECVRGESTTFASDVYSFAMCIVEAVTSKDPWNVGTSGGQAERETSECPFPPSCFHCMSDQQRELMKKMCALQPSERVSMAYVVQQLSTFAASEREGTLSVEAAQRALTTDGNAGRSLQDQWQHLAEFLVPEFSATIEDTLAKMQLKCAMLTESQDMALHVHARLVDIYAILLRKAKLPTDLEVAKYCSLLSRFQRYLRTPISDLSAVRVAKSRKAANASHTFHTELDRFLEMLGLSETDGIHSWRQQYREIYKTHYSSESGSETFISSFNSSDSAQSDGFGVVETSLSSGSTRSDGLGLGSKASTSSCDARGADTTESAMSDQSHLLDALPLSTPPWFLPMHELIFDEFDRIGEGSFGAVYRGTWLDTPVVVKFMGYEDDDKDNAGMFLHEATIWHPLNHPHVVRLFGACHVGKRFFVCEYASHGTLRGYLSRKENRRLMWRKLYEVAMGLQYLHDVSSVVHNDMKCDNILIGSDGKAKITDFGLSCTPSRTVKLDPEQMGALQWKAPEILTGGNPTFASDIYGLAMCLVEAVKCDLPWERTADVMVRRQARKGNLPSQPEEMSDEQWSLIEMMCVVEPARRVKISFVVEKLKEISELALGLDPNP